MTLSIRRFAVPIFFAGFIGLLGASSTAYGDDDPGALMATYRVGGAGAVNQAGCGSGSNPNCATISYLLANTSFSSGDIVLIEPGIYRETVTLTSDHNDITVQGDGAGVYIYGSEKPANDPSFTQKWQCIYGGLGWRF